MAYVLRDNESGKYFAIGPDGNEGFTADRIEDAIVCGDAHRSPGDAPHDNWEAVDVAIDADGEFEFAVVD